jgi:signal transduction histidine kinase
MWKNLSLLSRILIMLCVLVGITLAGGLVSLWHTYTIDGLLVAVADLDVPALEAAQELETSLAMQKGYVTYYFQDQNPEWLKQLEKHHQEFEGWLKKARQWAVTDKERAILNDIESQYIRYTFVRDEVTKLYNGDRKIEGLDLQKRIRGQFFQIIELCRQFKRAYEERILEARRKTRDRASMVNALAVVALLSVVILGAILGSILIKDVLGPIRRLAMEADFPKSELVAGNEVKALSLRFQTLINDVDQTKSSLKSSREHLQQAEKWAIVGKLAAGVAHSVRNPLTSVKMRLFSMERTLDLAPSQKEDFEVISEEIGHIDTIVNNFLEFSRPPKLKMQRVSPSEVVDMAIQLLRHRLDSHDVKVEVRRTQRLPDIQADPDQLKEVLVNLLVNACESMVQGGSIRIEEELSPTEAEGPAIIIQVSDNGPGIPLSIQDKLFQPFFSTKEEGTGLGLSIATRIVEDHGGWLDVRSKEGEGSTFVITLPITEEHTWVQS